MEEKQAVQHQQDREPMSDPSTTDRTCSKCGGPGARFRCTHCQIAESAYYCSKECQKSDWSTHKKQKKKKEIEKSGEKEQTASGENGQLEVVEKKQTVDEATPSSGFGNIPFRSFTDAEAEAYEEEEREKEKRFRKLGREEMEREREFFGNLSLFEEHFTYALSELGLGVQLDAPKESISLIVSLFSGLRRSLSFEKYEKEVEKIEKKYKSLKEKEKTAPEEMKCQSKGCENSQSFMLLLDRNVCCICEKDTQMTKRQCRVAIEEIEEERDDAAISHLSVYASENVLREYKKFLLSLPEALKAFELVSTSLSVHSITTDSLKSICLVAPPPSSFPTLGHFFLYPLHRLVEMDKYMKTAFSTCDELHEAYDELEEAIEIMKKFKKEIGLEAAVEKYTEQVAKILELEAKA